MTTTRAQIRTQALEILQDASNSDIFTPTVLNQLITQCELEAASMWKWQFLRDKKLFRAPVSTNLSAAITTASTSMTVAKTENYETPGAVRMMHDIINYTGKTDGTLTGVTNISVDHDEGELMYPLISLPSDYHKLLDVYVSSPVGSAGMRKLLYVPEFEFDRHPAYLRYCVVSTGQNNYLLTTGQEEDDTMVVHFQMKPATYTSDTDVSSFPDEYCYVIARMVAGKAKIYLDDDLDGMGTRIYTMAKEELLKMTKLYGEREQGMSRLLKSNYNSYRRSDGYGYRNYRD